MSFNIDKQTLDELNLLGKFRHGSVYGLFNKVRTGGGERLLDHMFRNPLQQQQAINERSSLFLFFQQANLDFPFDAQQVAVMREYLDAGAAKNAVLVFGGTLLKKILSGLTRDERHKKDVQGLQAVIVTLHKCHHFIETLEPLKGPWLERVKKIKALLSDKRLERLRNIDIYKALPLKAIASYSHLLKSNLHKEMEEMLSFIYELDVYITVSDVARLKKLSYSIALPTEKNIFSAKDLRHPCIDEAVGNTISLQQDNNVLFLTGANMAGKSTLMKSIGINMYLAHMGFPVAVNDMEFSVRDGLYSSINVADNINLGYSHFYAEVVRVKRAAEAAASGKRLLLMFDELFKGTNVKDAFDGTLAVTKGFAGYHDCLFIVSTHIIEVGEALKKYPNIHFVFMPTIMDGLHPRYTYQLQDGITEDRQGMMIIRNEGILKLLNGE